jgi:hypothetical protein
VTLTELCAEGADRIEALEQAIWKMHGEAHEHIKRIEALEAALRELASDNYHIDDYQQIARCALRSNHE